MKEPLELNLESTDGIVDCELEYVEDNNSYNATILYPHTSEGMTLSKVYTHTLQLNRETGTYVFAEDYIHPKVKALEEQIAMAIAKEGY
ncbi:MAG: hypothetical protein H0X33_11190 [Taibaiella sp.]|nr:hypothetical protein [Taibaiella sp.]